MAKTAQISGPKAHDEAAWQRLAQKYLFTPPDGHINLNSGTLSPTPKPVFEAAMALRRDMAAEPSTFLWRKQSGLLQRSRAALAGYLGCSAGNLILVPNATWGMNLAATAVKLRRGDEVVFTEHEYGACTNSWLRQIQQGADGGGKIVLAKIPFSPSSAKELIDAVWAAVTPRTKVLHLSHVNYTTGLVMPVEALCAKARKAGSRP